MALHLGEIAQDDRWEKQRSGRMMALHCRSRAGPVRSSLGKRVPQTRSAQLGLTILHLRIEPDEPSYIEPERCWTRSRRVVDLARREHIQQFWDSEAERARELGVFGSPTFVAIGNCSGASGERSPLRIVFTENEPEGARTAGSGTAK